MPEQPPRQRHRNVRRPDRKVLPVETVRDLLGIVRALYRAERGQSKVGDRRLRELEAIGRELRIAIAMATKTPDPDTMGHRAAVQRAEDATRRLVALVDEYQALAPALRATSAKVVR